MQDRIPRFTHLQAKSVPPARSTSKRPVFRPVTGAIPATLFLSLALSFCITPASSSGQAAPQDRQIGTVKTVSANHLQIATDSGTVVAVNVVEDAKILQLSPGSTNLKAAVAIRLGDIEAGDRVFVTGHADAATAFTAARVVLMKSTAIAQKHESEQADWQKRGTGGLVGNVDPATGTITVSARGAKITVKTSPATVYRRYAGDSVKYQDAVPGTFAQIQSGDQLRARGTSSGDASSGVSIEAEEIVSGSFRNLAGTVVSLNAAAGSLTVKDLASKKTYTIQVTPNSNLRKLPPEDASRFAARSRPGPPAAKPAAVNDAAPGAAGADLSQMLPTLPLDELAGIHPGDSVMVVASQPLPGSISLTAITILSGVGPILAATPSGAPSMTLSPWNVAGPDGGGA